MCLFSTQCYCTYLPMCPRVYSLIPKYSFFIVVGCTLWKPALQTILLYFLCMDKKQKFLEFPILPLCEAEQTDRIVIFPSLPSSSWEFITSFSPFFFFQLLNSLYMYISVPYPSIYRSIHLIYKFRYSCTYTVSFLNFYPKYGNSNISKYVYF